MIWYATFWPLVHVLDPSRTNLGLEAVYISSKHPVLPQSQRIMDPVCEGSIVSPQRVTTLWSRLSWDLFFYVTDTCDNQQLIPDVLLSTQISDVRCNQLGGCNSGKYCLHNTGKYIEEHDGTLLQNIIYKTVTPQLAWCATVSYQSSVQVRTKQCTRFSICRCGWMWWNLHAFNNLLWTKFRVFRNCFTHDINGFQFTVPFCFELFFGAY